MSWMLMIGAAISPSRHKNGGTCRLTKEIKLKTKGSRWDSAGDGNCNGAAQPSPETKWIGNGTTNHNKLNTFQRIRAIGLHNQCIRMAFGKRTAHKPNKTQATFAPKNLGPRSSSSIHILQHTWWIYGGSIWILDAKHPMFDPEAISIQEVWAALILPFQVWYPRGAEELSSVISPCPRTHLWEWASPCLRCFWPQRCNLASLKKGAWWWHVQPIKKTPGCKLNTIMFIGFNRTTQFFRLFEGPSVCWASQENTSSKELSAWSHSPYSPRCWCGISGIGVPPLRFLDKMLTFCFCLAFLPGWLKRFSRSNIQQLGNGPEPSWTCWD